MHIYKLVEDWDLEMLKDSVVVLDKEGSIGWWVYRKKNKI